MTETSTAELAQQQAALAGALVGNGSTPEGFDAQRIAMASKMLLQKRSHAALASWPAFAQSYGPDLEKDFADYALVNPMKSGATARDDLLSFAKVSQDQRKLPRAVLRLLCAAESRYFIPVRRGPFISLRLPLLGILTFRLTK